MIRLLEIIAARRRRRRNAASGLRVALVGNIANNAFNMVNILRRQGISAQLIDDGTNTFAFSRPAWEECYVALSYPEVMHLQRTPADWARLERRWGWRNGGRVVEPCRRGWMARPRNPFTPQAIAADVESALARSGLDSAARDYLREVVSRYGPTIRWLRDHDVVIAFGFLAAACAYLAERPTLYFTYGGDCRVELADRDGSRALLSRVFAHILASERFAIEGYGCDQEIHEVLRARGLLDKVAYAFLPNVNVALLRQPWDRDAARASLGWPRDKLIFFLASRVDYTWKQSDVFLDAFGPFARQHGEVLLAITGWGNDYRDARQRMTRQGLTGQVVFLDECFSKPNLFRRYAAADVIIDQFKVGSLGSVSYEALCMGKPVLTYLAPFNLSGYPSPPPILNARTRADIRAQLEFCAAQPEALKRIGQQSAQWYADVYAEENLASCVRAMAEIAPRKWIATSDFRRNPLPAAEIPLPGHQASARLLPWPYPYRAGFALANDCEYFAWDDFLAIYRWLATREATPLGPGLGLPVSASFWFYSEDPEGLGFSYFEGSDWRRKSRLAPRLAELLRCGFLDTLHTYGGFDLRGDFRRAHAEAAVEELDRLGARLAVWTNHGNASNVQNLGGLWANDYAQGDAPGHAAYHADLLAKAGFRYFWLDAYATNRFSLGTPLGRAFEHGLASPDPSPWGDRILCADRLRDGQEILAFRRFRGKRRWAPDPGSLADQISSRNLDHLEETGGAVILYQHLGCFRHPDGLAECGRGRPLPRPAARQLLDLADRYRSQRIWVAPCAAFLRYLDTVGQLRLDVESKPEGVVLVLSGYRDEIGERELAGVSILVRGPAGIVGVEIAGRDGRRTPCRSCREHEIAAEEKIIAWPMPAPPEFPFAASPTAVTVRPYPLGGSEEPPFSNDSAPGEETP